MSPAPNRRSNAVFVGSPISQGTPEGGITGMFGPAIVAPGLFPTLQ